MFTALSSPLRRGLLASTLALAACGPALAQAPASAQVSAPASGLTGNRPDAAVERRIERIRYEDRALSIEEVRHGGETQSISVTPRDLPAWELQPTDGARSRLSTRDGLSQANGARVWNLLRF